MCSVKVFKIEKKSNCGRDSKTPEKKKEFEETRAQFNDFAADEQPESLHFIREFLINITDLFLFSTSAEGFGAKIRS